jgi:hypothetical protein
MSWTTATLLIGCLSFPLNAVEAKRLGEFSVLELEIVNQRNERGRKIPDEWIPQFRDQVLSAIAAEHLFSRIGDFVDPKAPASGAESPVLVLRLVIVDYTGAQNNAGVTAMARFLVKTTGEEILSERMGVRLRYDQGALSGVLRKLARSTAVLVREHW